MSEENEVKPWTGKGLPPAGTVCEHKRVHEWQKVEVFAVKPNYNGSHTALFTYESGCWAGCAEPSLFRPILTPELAAQAWLEGVAQEYGAEAAAKCEDILMQARARRVQP